jgi:pheromone a factor receptor
MKSKIIGSSGKIRPVLPVFVQKEMLQRHSFDSFNNLSIGDVSGALTNQQSSSTSSTSDPEKKLDCYPDLSYSRNKVNSFQLSSPSSMTSLSSSASSITYPTPARTRQDSGIEISSAHRDSSYIEEPVNLPISNSSESSHPHPRSTTPIDHSAV